MKPKRTLSTRQISKRQKNFCTADLGIPDEPTENPPEQPGGEPPSGTIFEQEEVVDICDEETAESFLFEQ